MKKKRGPKSGCIACGGPCTVDCIDNFGNPYKGCPRCRLKSLEEIEAMTKTTTPTEPAR